MLGMLLLRSGEARAASVAAPPTRGRASWLLLSVAVPSWRVVRTSRRWFTCAPKSGAGSIAVAAAVTRFKSKRVIVEFNMAVMRRKRNCDARRAQNVVRSIFSFFSCV
jgi:hypothetical protein